MRIIDAGVKLDHFKHPPTDMLERLYKDLNGKPFAQALLREMVLNYLYMYRTEDVKARQRLGGIFGIESTQVKFLDNPSKKT